MRKKLKYIIFAVFLVLVIPPVADNVLNVYFYQPSMQSSLEKFEKIKPKILDDLKIVDQQNLFPDYGTLKNAEELFEKHISWMGSDISALEDENLKKVNALYERYKLWSKNPDILKALLKDKELNAIDLTWLDHAAEYDHWDVSVNPYTGEALKKTLGADPFTRIGAYASLPIPLYSDLYNSAFLRFLQLYKEKRSLEALHMFRKVNELTYSTGLLIGSMVSVKFFNSERHLVEMLKIKNWTPVSEDVTKSFKRVSWAWVGILKYATTAEISEDISKYVKVKNGICGASLESSINTVIDQGFFQGQFIFESNHQAEYERSKNANNLFLERCGLSTFEPYIDRSPASLGLFRYKQPVRKADFDFYAVHFPYARRIYGYVFSNLKAEYLGQYYN